MTSPGDDEIDQEAAEVESQSAEDNDDTGSDQDELAAEWESMVGDDPEGDHTLESSRILNQHEIDNLLGLSETSKDDTSISGIQALISSELVSYERLPMLDVVFDRLVRLMSTSLRNFTSDNVEVSLDNVTSIRFGDYLDSIPLPAILNVFKAEEWDNFGLITIDSALIYSIVDVLLGGRQGEAALLEGRPYTTIERSLVERMIHVMLSDLSVAFEPLSDVTFRFDRLETNPRFATISRLENAAILARLRIDMEDRGGWLELLLPSATLEPVRELLLQMFAGEKFGRDSIWETHLAEELWMTDVDLEAVIDTQTMRLADVLALKVGSQIILTTSPDDAIELQCGKVPVYTGRMGRRGKNIAIRIEDEVERLPKV